MQPLKKQVVRLLCRIVVGQAGMDGCAEGFGGMVTTGGDERLVIRKSGCDSRRKDNRVRR